ncbi:MAG: discoidin domain-containing protein [Armatimonadota bacterium]
MRKLYLSLGDGIYKRAKRGRQMVNSCINPGFELLNPAGTNFPLNWATASEPPSEASVTIDNDTHSGSIAVRMKSTASGVARMNSDVITVRKGTVSFFYKGVTSSDRGENLRLQVMCVTKSESEIGLVTYSVISEHIGDKQWHKGTIAFDFLGNSGAAGIIIGFRVNERGIAGDGEWLIDDVECVEEKIGANPVIEAFTIPDLVLHAGRASELIVQIANRGDETISSSTLRLTVPSDIKLAKGGLDIQSRVAALDPGKCLRLTWMIVGQRQANIELSVEWAGQKFNLTRHKSTACVTSDDPRALYTSDDGSWRLMPAISTLQADNSAHLTRLHTKISSELPDSMMGLTAHLPRSEDFEKIFDASHLIDGDWETSWSGRAHTTTVPGTIDWVQLELRTPGTIKEIRLVPYWHAEGFPTDFEIKAKIGRSWKTIYSIQGAATTLAAGDSRKQPYCISLVQPVTMSVLRIEATRFSPGSSFFTDCAVANYMRLSEIELIDQKGHNVALASNGTKVAVSSTYYSYFNTADVIRKTYPMVYDLGVKWNRVGFWGDMTTWAQVERTKGKYQLDPETDRAIKDSIKHGVKVLYCLCWGNRIYESTPWQADPGPVWRSSHPFTGDGGPTTDASIQAFVNYAKYVARHYKGKVKHWEIWNEENSWAWYGSPPDPKVFGTLVRETAKALKQIDPENYVIFGGTAAIAPTFLSEALELGGVGPYIDAISYHPYTMPFPEGSPGALDVVGGKQVGKSAAELGISTMEELLSLLRFITMKYNPKLEFWADEWCPVPTREDTPYVGCSELAQAKYIARFFLMGTLHNVRSVYYCMYSNTIYDQGILRVDLSKRPLFYTIQAMTTLLSGAKPDHMIKATAVESGQKSRPAVGDLTKLVVEAKIPRCTTSKIRLTNIATFMELEVFDSSDSLHINIAPLAQARSSSLWDGFGPEKGNDGDRSSRFSAKTIKNEWYELDWATERSFDSIALHQWSTLLHQDPIRLDVWNSVKCAYEEFAIIGGASPVRCETLRGRDGEVLVAVWYPVASRDDYPAKRVTVTINVSNAKSVQAVDPLHLVCQNLTFRKEGFDTVIDGLLVQDYPSIIRVHR